MTMICWTIYLHTRSRFFGHLADSPTMTLSQTQDIVPNSLRMQHLDDLSIRTNVYQAQIEHSAKQQILRCSAADVYFPFSK
jgi:hypothetical protein